MFRDNRNENSDPPFQIGCNISHLSEASCRPLRYCTWRQIPLAGGIGRAQSSLLMVPSTPRGKRKVNGLEDGL